MMKRAAVRTALQKELSRFAAETEGVPGAAERAKMIRARLVMNIEFTKADLFDLAF
jgi:hypothetical protein